MALLLLIILAYLIGSIPTSVWISRLFFGVDIRNYGSGNAGATNTYRVFGSSWGTLVMIIDVLKGVVATSLYLLIPDYFSSELVKVNLMIGLGMAALAGHIFPVLANFKGGKGVATLLGIIIAIHPVVAVSIVFFFMSLLYLVKWLSNKAVLAGALFVVIFFIYEFKKSIVFDLLELQFH